MSDIGPGDIVECVEGDYPFTVGSLYHVRAVYGPARCACMRRGGLRPWAFEHDGLLFHDAADPSSDHPMGWCCYHFRPVSRRTDFAVTLEKLKQPAPDRVLEPTR